jgi:hypothetical protein
MLATGKSEKTCSMVVSAAWLLESEDVVDGLDAALVRDGSIEGEDDMVLERVVPTSTTPCEWVGGLLLVPLLRPPLLLLLLLLLLLPLLLLLLLLLLPWSWLGNNS